MSSPAPAEHGALKGANIPLPKNLKGGGNDRKPQVVDGWVDEVEDWLEWMETPEKKKVMAVPSWMDQLRIFTGRNEKKHKLQTLPENQIWVSTSFPDSYEII